MLVYIQNNLENNIEYMVNNKSNLIGTIRVELNLYEIDNDEFSMEIVNDDDNYLINRINHNLKILDIIRNNNKIKAYESIIKEKQDLINESVHRKKQDILEVAKYMVSKEKEIIYYQHQIEDLNHKMQNNINNALNANLNTCDKLEMNIPNTPSAYINNKTINNTIDSINDINTTLSNKITDKKKETNETENIKNDCILDIIKKSLDQNILDGDDSNIPYKINYIDNNNIINLKYINLNCIIEIKDTKKNIGKNDIKKFINTYINTQGVDLYNCGIFISYSSNFTTNSKIKDFDILTVNNKPIIFISNFDNVPSTNKITYAIKLLQSIFNYKISNNINDDEINTYINLINQYYDILEAHIDIYDEKIIKYNTKLVNYTKKIECTKNKLESINLKKKDYIENLKVLENIPTLQLGMFENNTLLTEKNIENNTHLSEEYVDVQNEELIDKIDENNDTKKNIENTSSDNENEDETYSENFSNSSVKSNDEN